MTARPMLLMLALAALGTGHAAALEHVLVRQGDKQLRASGKLLVEAADGGLLLLASDGLLLAVEPGDIVERKSDAEPFTPLTADELTRKLLAEMGPGFEVHATAHYLVCHNSSKQYAQWCGGLLERLNRAFTNFWQRRGCTLREPEFPLVAVVFRDRESYMRHTREELGDAAESIVGFYSLRTNRVTMYDLTGVESLRRPGDRRSTAAQINLMLSRPEAENTVATVVHEATHQIAYNCGLHQRFADVPLWVSEGMAQFFETPDLASSSGWRGIGEVNHSRLARFREYVPRRPKGALGTLLTDDKQMRRAGANLDAYAEAWALTYYLVRQRPKEYVAYLNTLAAKPPMVWDSPEERLKEFHAAFGNDLDRIDADFLKQIRRLP